MPCYECHVNMEGSAWLCVNPVVRKVVGTRRLIYEKKWSTIRWRTNPPFLVLKSRMPLLLQEKIDLLLEDGCSTRTGSSQRKRARGE